MKKIVLKENCQANWDEMMPNEQGRHCASCSKTVYDVSDITNSEVRQKYQELDGNMCLRIPAERAIIKPKPWYARWKAAVAATALTCWLSAQQIVAKAQNISSDNIQDESKQSFEKCVVNGQVLDSLNFGNPIAFAWVILSLPDSTSFNAYTDSAGKFSITIERLLTADDTLTLRCTALGYEVVTRQSAVRDTIQADIFMEENHVCLNELVIKGRKTDSVIMGGMVGESFMGIPVQESRDRKVYRSYHQWGTGTRTFHSDEIERFNLGR